MATEDKQKRRLTRDNILLRPKGTAAHPLVLSAGCLVGIATIITGIWIPFAFEEIAWKHELESPVFLNSKIGHGKTEPLILKYPLMRMISRVTLGARYHTSRIKLMQDLPSLLTLIREEKFTDAEALLLDLFSIGAFNEDTEVVIWLQRTLKETSQIKKKIISGEATIKANEEDRQRIRGEWQKLLADIRTYLHVSSVAETRTDPDHPDPCNPDSCDRYQNGPLRGIPLQPEIAEAPESIEIFAKWYIKQLSPRERENLTDDAIKQPLLSFKERTSSLTTSYRQIRVSEKEMRHELKDYRKSLKSNAYLMGKKLEELIRIASTPPEIIFGDLIL